MKLDGIEKFIDQVTPERLVAYLTSQGWRQRSVVSDGRGAIWGRRKRLALVPLDAKVGDYRQRVFEAIEEVARAAGLWPTAVLLRLLPLEEARHFQARLLGGGGVE